MGVSITRQFELLPNYQSYHLNSRIVMQLKVTNHEIEELNYLARYDTFDQTFVLNGLTLIDIFSTYKKIALVYFEPNHQNNFSYKIGKGRENGSKEESGKIGVIFLTDKHHVSIYDQYIVVISKSNMFIRFWTIITHIIILM